MEILRKLRNDSELQELKEQWKTKTDKPFPIYHFNFYLGIEDYRNKIKEKLSKL